MTPSDREQLQIAFCVLGGSVSMLWRNEFYRQDIEALRGLGHRVTIVLSPFALLRHHFDLAFVWWWNYAWLWGIFALPRHTPIIATGVFDDGDFDGWPAWKQALKLLGTHVPSINILLSQYELRNAPPRACFRRGSVRYSPCVVDTNVYVPAPVLAPPFPFTVLSVAWQSRQNLIRKRVLDLVHAFARVHRSVPDTRLILAGPPGTGTRSLRTAIETSGAADAISLLGPLSREDKIRWMQRCSLYCQVSDFEGFGLATAEAMAAGAPVLVSDTGATRAVVGDCGVYVNEVSVKGIAHGLRWCIENPETLDALRPRARRRIEGLFPAQRRRADLARFIAEARGSRGAICDRYFPNADPS